MKFTARALLAGGLALGAAACAHSGRERDLTDSALKARIMSAFHDRRDLDLRYVTVDVDNAEVTLSGLAASPEQRRAIDLLVRNVPGVDHILDNLVIQE